ncbi:MAG: hypothetical protein ACE5G3_10215 [Gammaproteobacteria bacterium]
MSIMKRVTDPAERRISGRRAFLFAIAALLPAAAAGHHKLSRKECARISARMKRLQSRLRQGHTARQGRRHHARMRELQLQRFRGC